MNKILKARNFAIKKHANQKYGEHDYVYHLDQVYEIGLIFKLTEEELIAIYLHDILEDTDTKKEEIINMFSENIFLLVNSVSGYGSNRKEKKISIIQNLIDYPKGINIKMCDRLANMRESKTKNKKLFEMYVKELPEYIDIFKNGKKELFDEIVLLGNYKTNKLVI